MKLNNCKELNEGSVSTYVLGHEMKTNFEQQIRRKSHTSLIFELKRERESKIVISMLRARGRNEQRARLYFALLHLLPHFNSSVIDPLEFILMLVVHIRIRIASAHCAVLPHSISTICYIFLICLSLMRHADIC